MLSVLIPVYNVDVTKMVNNLFKQCKRLGIVFEIVVYDDGSDEKYKSKNMTLGDSFGINYLELKENLGRAKIRNWLVKSAAFDHVLFLDCDAKVSDSKFVKNYIDAIGKADLIVGGRKYSKAPPKAKSKYLHWLYGTKSESKPAKVRNKAKVNYFHTNNFLARRKVLDKIQFDESTTGYGYEDLVFGAAVTKKGYTILHIDNPVEHLGVETNAVFLEKTETAIKNLLKFEKKGLLTNTRLQSIARRFETWSVDDLVLSLLKRRSAAIKAKLLAGTARLWEFQCYKLYLYYENKNV